MAETLTPAQREAVENRGGKLLVSAAAGSGKTKVLVDRLMGYLMDPIDPADLDEFLIITYTRAAASELRAKIAKKLNEHIAANPEDKHLQKQLQRLYLTEISTVHGFCGDILKEYAYRLDLDADFRVADENACQELREEVLKDLLDNAYIDLLEDAGFRAFADTQGLGRTDKALPELITKVYDSARCHPDPESWLDGCLLGNLTQAEGAEETPWGKFLMEDLFRFLDGQIAAMERCVELAGEAPTVQNNLADTLHQLKHLRESSTWDEAVDRIRISFGRLVFPRKGDPVPRKEEIKAVREACKEGLAKQGKIFSRNSKSLLEDLEQMGLAQQGLITLVRRFGKEYGALKKKRRVLDFGDLEHKTLDLLLGLRRDGPTAAAREIGKRYREVLVDEYQDSNAVQDAIFGSITREKQNCFLVGDVKQSIYQFRLADPGIFLDKYNRYGPAAQAQPGQGRRVLLSDNFRSGGEVVEAVNQVFSCCMSQDVGGLRYGEAEALREGIPHEPLPNAGVEFYTLEAQEDANREEAAFVAGRIGEMLNRGTLVRTKEGLRPVTPEDIVILLRSPGSLGAAFRQALEKAGIRCATGAGEDLLKTPEVATLRSILQTISNPRQDIPLLSALASPAFGFTADDLARIRSGKKDGSIYDAILASDDTKAVSFRQELEELRKKARRSSLTELMEHLLLVTNLDGVYAAQPGGDRAKENLRTFFQLAVNYEQGNLCTLEQFLEHLEAQEEKGLLRAGTPQSGAVTIMSIHKSKGLEFPVVFLCGLSRKFNQESLREGVLCDPELGLGLMVADTAVRVRYPSLARLAISAKMNREAVSEELRVLYVAMTRAKDRLIMTYAAKKAAEDVRELALRLGLTGREDLCREARCPGDWVLLSALHRTEAGALRGLSDVTLPGSVSDHPWVIRYLETHEEGETVEEQEPREAAAIPRDAAQTLKNALAFVYPYAAATRAASKQTATGRKGREKDQEAAQDAPEEKKPQRVWRRASFTAARQDGRSYGSAMHRVMQYLHFDACGSTKGVKEEVGRMVTQGFLTAEEGRKIDCDAIARFFETDLGWRVRLGGNVLREFKFSILDQGEKYGPGLKGEHVLLQGVVDCALLEEDGITIVDFKTDRIEEEDLPQAVERYRLQVETYREAMERIYEKPVKKCLLYFFRLGRFAEV